MDIAQTENGVQAQKNAPIQAGRVTTIQNPYSGDVPVQTAHTLYTQEVSDAALKTAETNLQTARAASTMNGGKGIKTLLTNIYKQTFKPSLGVAVNGMTFHGQPYLVDVNSNVPGKVISDPNLSAEKLSLLEMLPTVEQNGEYVGSGEYVNPGNSRKEVIRYDYFECPVTINGVSYIATFDVQVEPGTNNYRTHKIIKMDLTDVSAARTAPAAGTTETNLAGPIGKDGVDPITSDGSIPQTGTNSQVENVDSDGMGAANAGFNQDAGPQVPTQNRTVTEGVVYTDGEKRMLEPGTHERISEAESLRRADEYIYTDSNGNMDIDRTAQGLLEAQHWDSVMEDAAMLTQQMAIARARETGQWNIVRKLAARIEVEGTRAGQALQARKKWITRSGDNKDFLSCYIM